MPKEKIIDLLYELMKDSKRSDRELAKIVRVSQPTVTRMRKVLEKQGYIREYTVIPYLEKLGFEIVALTFISANLTDDLRDWISKNSKILFSCFGEGLDGRALLLVSVHKNFTEYSKFADEIRRLFGSNIASFNVFLSSLNVDVVKHFSLKNLESV